MGASQGRVLRTKEVFYVRNGVVVDKVVEIEEVNPLETFLWHLFSPFMYVFRDSLQALCCFAVVILVLMSFLGNVFDVFLYSALLFICVSGASHASDSPLPHAGYLTRFHRPRYLSPLCGT
jgi:hypothetical protein